MKKAFAEKPESYGNGEPDDSCEREDDPRADSGKPNPEDEGKASEGYAADCDSVGVDSGDSTPPVGPVETGAHFVLFFVRFDQAGAGWEDGWEGEKESTYDGAIPLCDEAGSNADSTPEYEADDPLVWFNPFDGGKTCPDEHRAT
ncbi:MAG: hypothetical protein JST28_13110 [Acidobacteria bacterium]|nr:hypothetical protein [Acidobacteriota bacterium]